MLIFPLIHGIVKHCCFLDIKNVHNVMSTFLPYVIIFFLQVIYHQVSFHLTYYLVNFFFDKVLF